MSNKNHKPTLSNPIAKPAKLNRPSAANIIFLLLTAVLIVLITQTGAVQQHNPPTNPPEQETTDASPYTHDQLNFYQDTITQLLLEHRFNGAVLMAKQGTVLFSRSFGFANFRDHTPLTPETPFQLASISKTFTAAAILLLQQDGKLHIDDKVEEHIPQFPYPEISIRHLLNHTSGIQNYMWLVERYWDKNTRPTNEDVLDLFLHHQHHLDFWPGTRFAYSNTGYAFLALVIERVTDMPYAYFIQENIFDPLGMENSFVYDPNNPAYVTDDRAYGFRRWGRHRLLIPDVDHDGVMGDKGIYSNIYDLYTWDRTINEERLLPDTIWDKAFEHTRLRNNRTVRYGMGWRLKSYMGSKVVHHPGRWNGFRTTLKRFAEQDATLIILNNTSRNIIYLAERLQNILFREERDALHARKEQEDDPKTETTAGGG